MSNPDPMPLEGFGPEAFAQATGVSHETLTDLKAYAELLAASPHNLVSEASLKDVWHRHFYDSAQLDAHIPENAKTLADLGSGAGFPGLVLAILRRKRLKVTLYEGTKKKADFLKAVAQHLYLAVDVRNERIEAAPKKRFDIITARAFAPLPTLLAYAQNLAGPKTTCLFLKGQNYADELTEAGRAWKMTLQKHPSQTHPLGVVLEIRDLIHASSR
jgi:16S rRNA (guanine527-N7)-methyltransferase